MLDGGEAMFMPDHHVDGLFRMDRGPIIRISPLTTCALPRRKKTPPGPMAMALSGRAGPSSPGA